MLFFTPQQIPQAAEMTIPRNHKPLECVYPTQNALYNIILPSNHSAILHAGIWNRYKHWLCPVSYRELGNVFLIVNLGAVGGTLTSSVTSATGASSHWQLVLSGIKVHPYTGKQGSQGGFISSSGLFGERLSRSSVFQGELELSSALQHPCAQGLSYRATWEGGLVHMGMALLCKKQILKEQPKQKSPLQTLLSRFWTQNSNLVFSIEGTLRGWFWAAPLTISYFSSL